MANIENLEREIKELNAKLAKICESRDRKSTLMPKEYYVIIKERQSLESELRELLAEKYSAKDKKEVQHTFVNSYGEATKRKITTDTYERTQRRIEKAVLINMGVTV